MQGYFYVIIKKKEKDMTALPKEKLEQLQAKAQKVRESALLVNAEIERAVKEEAPLKEEAIKIFGTDDLALIETKINLWEKENEALVEKYEAEINALELEVKVAQQKMASL